MTLNATSEASEADNKPVINDNPALQSYYQSLESRIGYRLVLGGTRHFGYWDHDTYWPFPLSASLRRMEDKLAERLSLPPGSRILDAGCGVGAVAITMASKYKYRIQAIDVVEHHVAKAQKNVARAKLPKGQIDVRRMDYHHLESLDTESFDGLYTMETFVHATDPKSVLKGFHRLLRPGGRLVLFEYDNVFTPTTSNPLAESMRYVNKIAAMPTNDISHPGVFTELLEEAGFTNIELRDYSDNIRPMTRVFYLMAYIPYLITTFLGLQRFFINTMAGVGTYQGYGSWRYVAISATKPGGPIEAPKSV
ncbi:S-adenosyl-L-methionine-dependent methyltransferase [Thelonectria olida]|uniref:S-adenosyl-L-methionine-dependent methyltransferase n=1 Tax=Thelonectria olida TaxID=1576542 RepID=A0A9P8W4H1_9HYPO|nr:S-adenosyl-L-methionine-dependent methyltransferase [Thelonectria olida]